MLLAIVRLGRRLRSKICSVIWEYGIPRGRRTMNWRLKSDFTKGDDTVECWTRDTVHTGLCNDVH